MIVLCIIRIYMWSTYALVLKHSREELGMLHRQAQHGILPQESSSDVRCPQGKPLHLAEDVQDLFKNRQ